MSRIGFTTRTAGLMVFVMVAAGCWGGRPKPSPSASTPPAAATTEERIAAAERAGRITAGTALLYRVYALYGDPALPAEYRAPHLGVSSVGVLRAAGARIGSLPAGIAGRLAPFLVPPGYDDSWWSVRQKGTAPTAGADPCRRIDPAVWSYVDAVSPVRVWAPRADADLVAAAAAVRDEVDRHIWDAVTGYFGQEPRRDSGPCAAGSDRLDIWVVHTLAGGLWGMTTTAQGGGCDEQPSYIEVAADVRKQSEPYLFSAVAHELSHAVVSARPLGEDCDDYIWLDEATANWTEQLTYPDVDGERMVGGCCGLITFPESPLDLRTSTSHAYSAYVFLMYLAETVGRDTPRLIWEKAAATDSLKAVDQAAGGFRKVWPGFARARWNQPPVASFTAWDKLTATPLPATDRTVNLNARSTTPVPVTRLAHLASTYHRIVFANAAAGWGAVVRNGVSDRPDAATHLFVKAAGQWREEALTGRATSLICDESLQELVVAISNSAMTGDLDDSGTAVEVDRCGSALPMAVRMTPRSVIGGTPMQGAVELNRKNDDGWLQLSLKCENPAVTVPPAVVVAPGQTQAAFTATTRPVTATSYGFITAANPAVPGSPTAYTDSSVIPPCPTLIALPARVRAGADFKGTVTLNGPAPSGGLAVSVQAHLLDVPATITIPAGDTSVTFEGQGGDPGCGNTSCERTGEMTVNANGCIPVAHTVVFQ